MSARWWYPCQRLMRRQGVCGPIVCARTLPAVAEAVCYRDVRRSFLMTDAQWESPA